MTGTIVACAYALLVVAMWGPLGWKQGLPAETVLVYTSQVRSTWEGFSWPWAGMRIYVSFFYHFAYVLAEILGIKGSFFTYQLVYLGLVWGRGFLAFLILRRVLKGQLLFSFLVGAIMMVHGSDTALNWAGDINIQGTLLWMTASIYLLVRAMDARKVVFAILWTGAAMLGCYMALWTYESEIFVICAVPLLLLIFRYGFSRRTIAVTLIYWVVPLIYVVQTARLYFSSAAAGSYQDQVLRRGATLWIVLSDLWFQASHSLFFWLWPQGAWAGVPADSHYTTRGIWSVSALGVIAMVGGIWLMVRRGRREKPLFPSPRVLLAVLAVGVLLLFLSFPAYLLLARTLWRTQFLSSFGAAMMLASVIGLVATLLRRWPGAILCLVMFASGAIAFFGVRSGYLCSVIRFGEWEHQRVAMAEILQVAPRVKLDTVIVLVNIPKNFAGFNHNMWYDMALRLAYPGRRISGSYYYEDGTRATGAVLDLKDGEWTYDGKGWPTPLVPGTSFANTIIIRYDSDLRVRLLSQVPAAVTTNATARENYNPSSRIIGDRPPSDMARRRYIR